MQEQPDHRRLEPLFKPVEPQNVVSFADAFAGNSAAPEQEGPVLTQSSRQWVDLGKAIKGLAAIYKIEETPFLGDFFKNKCVESERDFVKIAAALSLLNDRFFISNIPLPSSVTYNSPKALPYFRIADCEELLRAGISLSGIVGKFDSWKKLYSEKDQKTYSLRDKLCSAYAKAFFTELERLLKMDEGEGRHDAVFAHVGEVGKYQSFSVKIALEEHLDKFEKKGGAEDPLFAFAVKALKNTFDRNGENASDVLVGAYLSKIEGLLPDEHKPLVSIIRGQLKRGK